MAGMLTSNPRLITGLIQENFQSKGPLSLSPGNHLSADSPAPDTQTTSNEVKMACRMGLVFDDCTLNSSVPGTQYFLSGSLQRLFLVSISDLCLCLQHGPLNPATSLNLS
jgi:hypothetical protein